VGGDGHGLRADAWLSRELPALSRTRLRHKIMGGDCLLNGHRFSTSTRLRAGDGIRITWRGAPAEPIAVEIEVLWEDDCLLAVNKPAGMACHPMGRTQSGTLIQAVRARAAQRTGEALSRGDTSSYPSLVNRLDVFSSGIVLVAATRRAHAAMQDLVFNRLVGKQYIVLVEGSVQEEAGRIDLPVGLDPWSEVRIKRSCAHGGRASLTEFEVLRRLPGHTLLHARPITGRQHQVRVHFAASGHPVWGDLLYRDERLFLRYQDNGGILDDTLPPRHFLHAARTRFTHPFTGAHIVIEAPLPADLRDILARLEGPAES
jgi:23S rRNA pseudouridine1911/1915/1917 synthase